MCQGNILWSPLVGKLWSDGNEAELGELGEIPKNFLASAMIVGEKLLSKYSQPLVRCELGLAMEFAKQSRGTW